MVLEDDRALRWKVQFNGAGGAALTLAVVVWADPLLNKVLFGVLFYLVGQLLFQKGLVALGKPHRLRQLLFVV